MTSLHKAGHTNGSTCNWLSSGVTRKSAHSSHGTIEPRGNSKKQNECLLLCLQRPKKREEGYILSLRISLKGRAAQRRVTASASQLVTLHALLIQKQRVSVLIAGERERVNEGVTESGYVCVCV